MLLLSPSNKPESRANVIIMEKSDGIEHMAVKAK